VGAADRLRQVPCDGSLTRLSVAGTDRSAGLERSPVFQAKWLKRACRGVPCLCEIVHLLHVCSSGCLATNATPHFTHFESPRPCPTSTRGRRDFDAYNIWLPRLVRPDAALASCPAFSCRRPAYQFVTAPKCSPKLVKYKYRLGHFSA